MLVSIGCVILFFRKNLSHIYGICSQMLTFKTKCLQVVCENSCPETISRAGLEIREFVKKLSQLQLYFSLKTLSDALFLMLSHHSPFNILGWIQDFIQSDPQEEFYSHSAVTQYTMGDLRGGVVHFMWTGETFAAKCHDCYDDRYNIFLHNPKSTFQKNHSVYELLSNMYRFLKEEENLCILPFLK